MFSYSILKHINHIHNTFVRYKNPPHHWATIRKKVQSTDKALEHFDEFYKQVFKKKWESIREGLLRRQKFVAVVNNYGDKERTMKKLELRGALNMRTLCKLEKGYIIEELKTSERDAYIKKIWKMEAEMEEKRDMQILDKKQYDINKSGVESATKSLEESLNNAEIDVNRLVDSRNALSSEILHEFVPVTKIKGNDDYIPENIHFKEYDKYDYNVKIEKEYDLHFPEHLDVYCYEVDNSVQLPLPKNTSTGVLNYYLMDGGSVLPVLALNLQPGDHVLDMCASPGGKSLLAIQTLYPDCIVSNDLSYSRTERINTVYNEYLYDFKEKWLDTGKVRISCMDGRRIVGDFNKILVDVPCTTDRHSLKENENNIFRPSRVKERLKLPELQADLLFHALKLVRKGGTVVYSTCSLSPIQNDGVVHMVLKRNWEETGLQFVVKDLGLALLQMRNIYELASPKILKYGHLVLPSASQNYGPTYFCKLERIQ